MISDCLKTISLMAFMKKYLKDLTISLICRFDKCVSSLIDDEYKRRLENNQISVLPARIFKGLNKLTELQVFVFVREL
jgi:hypothetical protein